MYDFITTLESFTFNEENLIDDLLGAEAKGNKYTMHKAWNYIRFINTTAIRYPLHCQQTQTKYLIVYFHPNLT